MGIGVSRKHPSRFVRSHRGFKFILPIKLSNCSVVFRIQAWIVIVVSIKNLKVPNTAVFDQILIDREERVIRFLRISIRTLGIAMSHRIVWLSTTITAYPRFEGFGFIRFASFRACFNYCIVSRCGISVEGFNAGVKRFVLTVGRRL